MKTDALFILNPINVKHQKEDANHIYKLATELVLTTCESIDSICWRLELSQKRLIKMVYGE